MTSQDFFEKILHHTKGRWARNPFVLAGWQRDEILRPLFGTVRYDDTVAQWVRQYRVAWLELARKNGKSELLVPPVVPPVVPPEVLRTRSCSWETG